MKDFTKGVMAAVCMGLAVKVAYDVGRIKEAKQNAKALGEIKEIATRTEQQLKALAGEKTPRTKIV